MFTGEMARKRIDSVAKKSDALPNLRTERHSSKFKQGSRTQRLSSKGKTYTGEKVVRLVCFVLQIEPLCVSLLTSKSVSRVSSVRLR